MGSNGLDFDDEDELQEWLQEEFKRQGWDAYREQHPKGTQYRADLIVHHEACGWIGIECKHMNTLRSASKIGQAVRQILFKYRGAKYPKGAGEINNWAVCPFAAREGGIFGNPQTVREFLCHFGIGIIWPNDNHRMMLDFAYSDSDTKISVAKPGCDRYGDIERISEMVNKKMVDDSYELGICQRNTEGHGCTAPAVAIVERGDYEIHLCKHHYERFELSRWEQQKTDVQTA